LSEAKKMVLSLLGGSSKMHTKTKLAETGSVQRLYDTKQLPLSGLPRGGGSRRGGVTLSLGTELGLVYPGQVHEKFS
jgi:hypothetical protein